MMGKMQFSMMLMVAALLATATAGRAHAAEPLCFNEAGRQVVSSSHCFELVLPKRAMLQWAAWLPTTVPFADSRIEVSGSMEGEHFLPQAIGLAGSDEPAKRNMLPINTPLLPGFSFRSFGVEERVSAIRNSEDDSIRIECRPGQHAAGIVMNPGWARWPRGAAGELVLRGRGGVGFQWGVAAAGRDPDTLQEFESAGGNADARGQIDLSRLSTTTDDASQNLVLVCPNHGARLDLTDIRLAPREYPQQGGRTAWVWQRPRWQSGGADLLADAARYKVARLYIALSIDEESGVSDPVVLRRFVERARRAGIEIWAVEGDPAMASTQGREHALARLHAIQRYQHESTPEARLGGVQYDIEPYQLSAYQRDPMAVVREWSSTVAALGRAAELPLDVVLPFWLLDSAGGSEVLDSVGQSAHSLTIMAYRTDATRVQQAAEPLLAWGAARNFPVQVALENGPLQDELTQVYAPVPLGRPASLWLLPEEGRMVAARLDRDVSPGLGKGYVQIRQQTIEAKQVSFLGDSARLLATSTNLEPVLRSWPNFAGMAYHGLLDN